jgi:hypothetical protein
VVFGIWQERVCCFCFHPEIEKLMHPRPILYTKSVMRCDVAFLLPFFALLLQEDRVRFSTSFLSQSQVLYSQLGRKQGQKQLTPFKNRHVVDDGGAQLCDY